MAHKYPALAIKNQNTEEIELKFDDDVKDTKENPENKENQEAAKEIKEKTKEII